MGNTQSTGNTKQQLRKQLQNLNKVAFNYIIHSNLDKLDQKEHCNDLIILTSGIIDKAFNAQEVEYIYQHTQSGNVVDKKNKELLMYFNKNTMDNFKKYDAASKKQNMCNSIAKYYVKIAHVLEAISSALDYQTSICHKRLNSIKIKEEANNVADIAANFDSVNNPSTKQPLQKNIESIAAKPKAMQKHEDKPEAMPMQEVKPKAMPMQEAKPKAMPMHKDMNKLQNIPVQVGGNNKSIKLADEISISNLDRLYNFNEEYNYTDTEKKELSEYGKQLKELYKADLLTFYKAYVDKNVSKLPDNITTFTDIEMTSPNTENYSKKVNNSGNTLGELSNKLKEMQEKMLNNELRLMGELQKIVTYEPISRKTKEGKITQQRFIELKTTLNDETLTKKIIPNLRKILTELYTTCQIDYSEILKIFDSAKRNIDAHQLAIKINEHY
jgi:chemotaxis protein histidine kinase CheA